MSSPKHPIIRELDDLTDTIINLGQNVADQNATIEDLKAQIHKLDNEQETLRRVVSTLMEQNVEYSRIIRENRRLINVDNR